MTTQLTRLGSLEFEDIKASIKQYLSTQAEFTDYNFDGAGITQLLNVLAYNSHYDALAGNFLMNEVFLDTATRRGSVVSRAKELGYTPKSQRSSSATLTVTLQNVTNQNTISSVIVPIGTNFTSSVSSQFFTYTTKVPHQLNKQIVQGQPIFTGNITVYEGILTQNTFTYNNVANTIVIPDVDVDTSTLKVEVYEGGAWVEYAQPQNFLTINSTSKVYMIQEGFWGFEIYFGDGVLGVRPANNIQVRLTYIVSSGAPANGANKFALSSAISGVTESTTVTISSLTASTGGLLLESLESIKYNAQNVFGTQNRAVTASDYAAIAAYNFQTIKNVLSWDGSANIPPKFGMVVLCVQPAVGESLLQSDKTLIANFLESKSVGNVKVDFVDPEYINLKINTIVNYNINNLQVDTYQLQFIVQDAITQYAATNIQKFGGSLRYSALLSAIDNSNYAIVSNVTTVTLDKSIIPNLFAVNSYTINFANVLAQGSLTSTLFNDGISSNKLFLKDLAGNIHIYYSLNGVDTLYQNNVGTIDYATGIVNIANITMASIDGTEFEVQVKAANPDIFSSKNIILTLAQQDITVIATKDTK